MSATSHPIREPAPADGPVRQAPFRVVAVDDSQDDLFFLSRAIARYPQFTCLATLSGGQQALRYFRREPPFADPVQCPHPDLVLLDLKMPGVDGFAVLKFLRENLAQRPFKVVVLTSSSAPTDERRSLELGADGFETKPPDHAGYLQLLQKLEASLTGSLVAIEHE